MNGQKEAISKVKGPCVVLAGAGTGKTYTIVEKIKYLIKQGFYEPEKIVCITFSNEAANNLSSRIQKALELEGDGRPLIKTFHAFSSDLLKKHGERIGIKDFSILDPNEAKVLLHKYLKVNIGNCHKYVGAIGTAKDLGITMESVREYLDKRIGELRDPGDMEKKLESLEFEFKTLYMSKSERGRKKEISAKIKQMSSLLNLKKFLGAWRAYEKIKKIKGFQDYSDLNNNALRLLQEYGEIASEFDYIVVDEFQDTNKVQLDLLLCLASKRNVMIVGDLNQSIYRFRGAYQKNFVEFRKNFSVPDTEIFNLDKSYRSSNKVLRGAYNLILNNYENKEDKNCFEVLSFDGREGENIEVFELTNAREEARKVRELVQKEIKQGNELREICVMFRTHQQGRVIKRALDFEKIPYVSVNKNSLFKENSVKSVIDYLTILNKLRNKEKGGDQAWWDLLYRLNFRDEDLVRIGRFIKDNRGSDNLSAVMLNSLQEIKLSDSGKMVGRILVERIKRMVSFADKSVPELIKEIYHITGLINRQETAEEKAVMMNLNRFYELAGSHSSLYDKDLGSFIQYLGILGDLGVEIEAVDSEAEGVRLMTLHATKGLEYKTVIITNLAQKRFPMERFKTGGIIPVELSPEFNGEFGDFKREEYERKNQVFDERRLCYVAFTRAKERLILTYAQKYGGRKYYPSQFLAEVKYKSNPDFTFFADSEEKYVEAQIEKKGSLQFGALLRRDNFDSDIVTAVKDREKFFVGDLTFSPSSLLAFRECQKKYEYKYVYHMPEGKSIYWEAIMMGSFVHRVLEAGVKQGFEDLKEFEDLARDMGMKKDWEALDVEDGLHLIKVFFIRNKEKYSVKSKTEIKLNTEMGGVKFTGFADRIDFSEEGIEIIDYKTGRGVIPPLSRNWQLGYYALASRNLGKVRKITLDMLRQDRPLEFEVDEKGNATPVNSDRMVGFNVYDVEQELVKAAHDILRAHESGFKACNMEKTCEFCSEWVYGL